MEFLEGFLVISPLTIRCHAAAQARDQQAPAGMASTQTSILAMKNQLILPPGLAANLLTPTGQTPLVLLLVVRKTKLISAGQPN